jgi:hypothetical protein
MLIAHLQSSGIAGGDEHSQTKNDYVATTTSAAWFYGWRAAASEGGSTFRETDDFSVRAAAEEIPLRDVHATLLQLMGLNQERLSYLHAGRYKKLTDIGGRVIQEILG